MFDNALDAGATDVSGTWQPKRRVIFKDNGRGVKDLEGMFRLGQDIPEIRQERIGFYGVGFKLAAIKHWGVTTVRSVHHGIAKYAQLDWERLSKASDWDFDQASEQKQPMAPSGTEIVFDRAEIEWPKEVTLARLAQDMAFLYFPAIRDGIILTIQGERLRPFSIPPLQSPIDIQIEVLGRPLRLMVGCVEDARENIHAGLNYVYRHRVVVPHSARGLGDYSKRNIFGIVTLGKGWTLSTTKDDIATHWDEIEDAIYLAGKPVFEIAAEQARRLQLDDMRARVTNLLQRGMASGNQFVRGKRKPGETHGTHARGNGKDLEREPSKITETERSSLTKPGKRQGNLNWDFRPMQSPTLGDAEIGTRTVTINETNAAIKRAMAAQDHFQLACYVYAVWFGKLIGTEISSQVYQRPSKAWGDLKPEDRIAFALGTAIEKIAEEERMPE